MNAFSMKKFLIAILLIVPVMMLNAQTWQWAISCGKSFGEDYGTIAADKSGNVYLAGSFQGIGIFGNDTLVSTGWGGLFLPVMFGKIDPSGSFQWVKGITGTGQSVAYTHVSVNQNSDIIYLYGGFNGDVNIGGYSFHSTNAHMFLSAYNSTGNCLWVKKAGGTKGATGVSAACTDPGGNFYITGITSDSAYFDSIMVHRGNYLAKYNSDGKCLWARNICSDFYVDGIASNGPRVILNGQAMYYGMPPFYFDSFLLDPTESMLVLASLDTFGDTQWAKIEGKGVYDMTRNVGIDTNNNIYVCGRKGGNLIFGNDTLPNQTGHPQLFLVKFNNEGNPIWARQTSGNNSVTPNHLTVGINNNIYIAGVLLPECVTNAITYFGNFPVTVASPPMSVEMFIAGYDEAGECIGVNHTPTDYPTMNPKGGNSVAVDTIGNCFVAGQFIKTTHFGQDSLTSQGKWDIFIAKCGPFYGTGTKELQMQNELIIYANPNEGRCSIILPEEFRQEKYLTLTLYNSQGQLIQHVTVEIAGEKISLDISSEAKGIYNASVSNGKKSYSGKIVLR